MPLDSSNFQIDGFAPASPSPLSAPLRPGIKAMPEGHRRLLVLAEFLETVPDEKLDLGTWQEGEDCGTSGCALGWACMIPEFRAAGLHFSPHGWPALGKHDGPAKVLDAAAEFFDIPWDAAGHFFVGSEAVGAEARAHVNARIRTFVAEQSAFAKAEG